MILLLAIACGGGAGDLPCDEVPAGARQEECRFQEALGLGSSRAALRPYLASIEDPASRDLIALRLAVRDPSAYAWLCEDVTTAEAQERCRSVLGRPHLRPPPKEGRR